MFGRTFSLEMRKQRNAALSILLVMSLGIMGTTAIVAQSKWSIAEAFLGVMTFCICALPLIGVALGSSAAMGIRSQNARDSEEMLPSNPAGKVFGSYLASAVYFLGLVLIVFAMYPSGKRDLVWIVLAFPYLHFLAFAITYALKLPVLGAGLATILVALDTFFVGSSFPISAIYPRLNPILLRLALSIPVWMAGIFALWMLCCRIERNKRPGLLHSGIAALAFLSSPVLSALTARLVSTMIGLHFGSHPHY